MANAKTNLDLIASVEKNATLYLNGPVLKEILDLAVRFENLLNQYDTDCAGARSDGFMQGRQQVEAETAQDRIEMASMTANLLAQVQANTRELTTAALERIGHEAAKHSAYLDGYGDGLADAAGPKTYADKI